MTQNQNVRTLSASQLERYRRNIDIPGLGERGQRALLDSKVLVVGVGGLWSPAVPHILLARGGRVNV